MPDQRQMSRSVGRSWRWHHPSVSLGTSYSRWQLRTCFYPKTPWSRVPNSMSAWPSSPADHFPSSEEDGSTIRELGAPCCMQEKPSPKFMWLASPATQWARYDTLDVRCHHQGQSQLAKSSVDLANVLHTRRQRSHRHVERGNGWLKKFQKLNSTGGSGRGRPKKTWTEMINMYCLTLGVTATHPSDRKALSGRFNI